MSKQTLTKHKQAVKSADSINGLAVHVARTKHEIKWDEGEVVCREEQWMKQIIKESLMIKELDNNLNLDTAASVDTNQNFLPHSSSPSFNLLAPVF